MARKLVVIKIKNMKKYSIMNLSFKWVICCVLIFSGIYKMHAQELPVLLPGPKGVVISLEQFYEYPQKGDSYFFPSPDEKILIYKAGQGENNFEKIAELSFPSSVQELENRLSGKDRESLLNHFKTNDLNEVYSSMIDDGIESVGLALLSPTFRAALGLIYIDSSWKKGEAVNYRFSKVKAVGPESVIQTIPLDGNYQKYNLQFRVHNKWSSDSLAGVSFYSKTTKDLVTPTYAQLYTYDIDTKKFIGADTTFVNSRGTDSVFVHFSRTINPMEQVVWYMRPLDLAGNLGPASDTLYMMNAKKHLISPLRNLQVTDTLNGLLMEWEPLPKTGVYSGIQILKSRQVGRDYVPLDTIASTEISYLDHQVIPGSQYYYKIRPLLLPVANVEPLQFTEIMGYKAFEEGKLPETPQGLQVTPGEKGVELQWKPNSELNLHGYYVLRGTSKRNLRLLAGPIRDYKYVDSTLAKGYTGQYTYALQVMDTDQNFSDTSAVASIFVKDAVTITSPGGINARRSGENINIDWENTRIKDNTIIGYMLYRRKQGTEKYELLNKDPIPLPSFVDSATNPLGSYEYVVSSIDIWGNQSVVSPTAIIEPDIRSYLRPPMSLSLRNKEEGVVVSWVEPRNIDGKKYIIYRRNLATSNYQEIAEVDPAATEFIDVNVTYGNTYEYAISVSKENLEGRKSKSEIIKRR